MPGNLPERLSDRRRRHHGKSCRVTRRSCPAFVRRDRSGGVRLISGRNTCHVERKCTRCVDVQGRPGQTHVVRSSSRGEDGSAACACQPVGSGNLQSRRQRVAEPDPGERLVRGGIGDREAQRRRPVERYCRCRRNTYSPSAPGPRSASRMPSFRATLVGTHSPRGVNLRPRSDAHDVGADV